MERLTNGIEYCKLHCDFGKSNDCFFSNKDKCYERSIYNRLKDYEVAEEQGLLLKLHLKVGDTVYYVISTMKNPIDFQIVKIEIFQDEIIYVDDGDNEWSVEDFGKLVFLTQAEAEQRLKEMGSDSV